MAIQNNNIEAAYLTHPTCICRPRRGWSRSNFAVNFGDKCCLLLIYRPQRDERLSWPSWLTYSGWVTHISGQPSATCMGRAWDKDRSSSAIDRRSVHWATQPTCGIICVILRLAILIQYRSVTDTHTQTDRQTDIHTTTAYTALSIASRGNDIRDRETQRYTI